jgi:hypothetical protein
MDHDSDSSGHTKIQDLTLPFYLPEENPKQQIAYRTICWHFLDHPLTGSLL